MSSIESNDNIGFEDCCQCCTLSVSDTVMVSDTVTVSETSVQTSVRLSGF